MNEESITIKPVNFHPHNILLESTYPTKEREIEIILEEKKILLKSSTSQDTSLKQVNIIKLFNELKELGESLYNKLDLLKNEYALLFMSSESNTKHQSSNNISKKYYLQNPYLTDECISILKSYFIKNGYPYLKGEDLLNLNKLKDNEIYTFTLDITFFVYFCISLYVISETYFIILHNKEKEVTNFTPLYLQSDHNNKDSMLLLTRGIYMLLNDINIFISILSMDISFYSRNLSIGNLNYFENKLQERYEYDSSINKYVTKDNVEMIRKGNKLYDSLNLETLSYSEITPIELLSNIISKELVSFNSVIIPTLNHLKLYLSNPSRNSNYHFCKSCKRPFYGVGSECNQCKKINTKESKKQKADNNYYDKISIKYQEMIHLFNTSKSRLNDDEINYLLSINSKTQFKKLYTKNKDKSKIDLLLKKMSNL